MAAELGSGHSVAAIHQGARLAWKRFPPFYRVMQPAYSVITNINEFPCLFDATIPPLLCQRFLRLINQILMTHLLKMIDWLTTAFILFLFTETNFSICLPLKKNRFRRAIHSDQEGSKKGRKVPKKKYQHSHHNHHSACFCGRKSSTKLTGPRDALFRKQ